jgi:hypothetical protein
MRYAYYYQPHGQGHFFLVMVSSARAPLREHAEADLRSRRSLDYLIVPIDGAHPTPVLPAPKAGAD